MDSNDILDDKDSGPEVQINLPSSVMSRIEELMGGTEQFDSEEFDAVAYINRVFPTEQSLSGVESAAARCEFRLSGVEHDIRRLVRAQAEQREAGQKALLEAQKCIAELALQVADINKKAERSESMVREITSEIKQLDCAKWNLTSAITALNHLHMLVGGVDSLRAMTDTRQYKEVVLPMQAIMEVLQHFESYRGVRELSALRERVHAVRAQLSQQILADFKDAFTAPPIGPSHRTLSEACALVDILDGKLKRALTNLVVSHSLVIRLRMTLHAGSKSTVSHRTLSEACALVDILDGKLKRALTNLVVSHSLVIRLRMTLHAGSKSTVSHRTLSEACALVDILDGKLKRALTNLVVSHSLVIRLRMTLHAGSKSTVSHRTLSEACALVDILDGKLKQDLLKWFIGMQLQEYQHLFSAEQECAWLSHVERRYAWLKRHLLTFEDTLGSLFPAGWRLSERIARQFCQITRNDLSSIMSARRSEIDVKLLLYAIQKTYNFELLLHKRFTGTDLGADSIDPTPLDKQNAFDADAKDVNLDTEASTDAGAPAAVGAGVGAVGADVGEGEGEAGWVRSIGCCFEPYLSLYIHSLDANLRAFMDRFVQDAKSSEVGLGCGSGAVIASCGDLFLFYKKCLVQCARLTTGEPMLELAGVFQKYLREYASSVLQAALPSSGPGPGLTLASLGPSVPSLVTNLQTLLKDDPSHTNTRYTKQEIAKITSVITTSEYCLETTIHLEQKLKEKVSPGLADKIDLSPEQDLFHKMISNCIQMLVQDLELACEPALQAMTKISWLNYDNVGDQSSYVTQIIMHLKNTVPNLRDNLASSRKYFTQFCIRFANSFIPKFIQNIYKCKPISTVGSEQLLLDTHMLKTALLELPSIGSEVKRPAPAMYTKVVIKLMTKAEMILKLVMAPLDGNLEGFVAQFLQLLPESTIPEFHKVLDMKGAKLSKSQLSSLDAVFRETAKNVNSEASK